MLWINRRVDALQFSVAIFTNLTGDHLDYHQDMANYARHKSLCCSVLAGRRWHRHRAGLTTKPPRS